MRMVILTILILTIISWVPAFAYDNQNEPYDGRGNPQYRYEGLSGKKYQYDLSDPADRLEYKLDLDAQMRDKLDIDPSIRLDRGMGQYGGGAEE